VQAVSAVAQYIETIPTSAGPARTGRIGATPRPLPPQVASEAREQGGNDAEALIELATSPTHGAPSRPTLDASGEPVPAQPSALDAVVSQIAEADERRLLVLLVVLGSMTLAALALAARRQRPSTAAPSAT